MKFLSIVLALPLVCSGPAAVSASPESVPRGANPAAVDQVARGTRTEADASWWGFDPDDATDAMQKAVDSGARKVVIPFMGQPWTVRPLKLRSDLELVFEPGVLLLAKKGEFQGGGDSMFSLQNVAHVTIRGYGAVLRMRKEDYQKPPYKKAEWRMGIRMHGCKDILIEGLRIEQSGGDGIYVDGGKEQVPERIVIRNCVCVDHHRQGMSVICAKDLLIENCVFSGTDGTPPEAGIDFEPDSAEQFFVNCVVRNCIFARNSGHAILVYLKPMTRQSQPVSIRFENCVCRMGQPGMKPADFVDPAMAGWAGMAVGAIKDDGPEGLVEFVDCTVENSGREGAKVFDKSARSAKVRFVRCNWSGSWVSRIQDYGGPRVPVLLELRRNRLTQHPGGVEFDDCHVFDQVDRNVVEFTQREGDLSLEDVAGKITVFSPHQARSRLGREPRNVTLAVKSGKP